MGKVEQVRVPDIGTSEGVDVIEVLVSVGDAVDVETPLITLESDKASMDVPSPLAGTVTEIMVEIGRQVSEGDLIVSLEMADHPQVAVESPRPLVHEIAAAAHIRNVSESEPGRELDEIRVPDIGEFDRVGVIEVLVAVGDPIAVEDPLITVESDKASMEIPAPMAGIVKKLAVSIGDDVSQGDLILTVASIAGQAVEAAMPDPEVAATIVEAPAAALVEAGMRSYSGNVDQRTQVMVLGAGPGGYTAAFRAADLGLKVVLVNRDPSLGGVCLNVGCIPSKALLHAAKLLDDSRGFADHGIEFGRPKINLDRLRGWKESVVSRLTGGLTSLAKQRKVQVVTGVGRFLDSYHVEVTDEAGQITVIGFDQAIIAAGSEPVKLPFLPEDPRIVDSTGALDLAKVPKRMLVIGGGIIGLEMATVYSALGSEISVVEMLDGLIPGTDRDLVKPLQKVLQQRYEKLWLETRVTAIEGQKSGLKVSFDGKNAPDRPERYDLVLVAVGRSPNGGLIGADKAGVQIDERGFITVDTQQRTNINNIFAIGDLVGQPMLAHKATHEGKVAAEVCAGMKSHFDARVIPSVAYTDPEVAWVGLTETEAKLKGIAYGKGAFPWAASGRALSLGVDDGVTKLLFDEDTKKVIGGGIVGPHAGDLIAEVALAIENNCDAEDIGLTVHPHPTLSETVAMAAEAFEGTLTDLYMPKKK